MASTTTAPMSLCGDATGKNLPSQIQVSRLIDVTIVQSETEETRAATPPPCVGACLVKGAGREVSWRISGQTAAISGGQAAL